MLDAKKIAETEQNISLASELFPAMYWNLYRAYIEKGFTDAQSFELIKTHIIANSEGPKKV